MLARRRPAATAAASALLEALLAGERRAALVDQRDGALVDVGADDVVAVRGDLRGERQAHLPEGDDDGLHSFTVSPPPALASAASA